MSLRKRPAHLPETVYKKIKADKAPEDVLNGLLDACAAVAAKADIDGAIDTYCRGKELCGPEVPLGAGERLSSGEYLPFGRSNQLMMLRP